MRNQKAFTASKSTMDARKLLSTINQGFAGQSKLLEQRLDKLGEEFGRKFRLVSTHPTSLLFQDAKSNNYYKADYKKDARSIVFENIQQIEVVDQKKPEIFSKTCAELIEAIEENNTSKIDKVFQQLECGHCTPNVIPESGLVRTRDGNMHRIVAKRSAISEEVFPLLTEAIKEAVKSSRIVISEGMIKFESSSVKIPVTELTRRQVVARNMRKVAESAHTSPNFQRLIKAVAGHVSNNVIPEAIKLSKGFFAEQQEFTLLDKKGFYTLIENALYSIGIFNYRLVSDTASLLWETNCHVNKADIIKEWRTAAEKTKIPAFIKNVKVIEEAATKHPKVFSETYDRFLCSMLNEDMSAKAVKAQAYLNMLKLLKNVVAGSDADAAVQSTVDDLIMRLESDLNNIDDALLYEVEDLLATTSTDLVNDVASLGDFDKVPEPQAVDSFGGEDMVGEFDGDMGDGGPLTGGAGAMDSVGGGAPDLNQPEMAGAASVPEVPGGNSVNDAAAAAAGAGAGTPPAVTDTEDEEEKQKNALDLAHVIKNAKPISEMTAADITAVTECLKGMKPEAMEEGDKEFKSLRKKDLSESESNFVRAVVERAKAIDAKLHEAILEAQFNLVIGEVPIVENQTDAYSVLVNDVAINADYAGNSVAEEWEKPWLKKDKEEDKKEDDKKGPEDKAPKSAPKEKEDKAEKSEPAKSTEKKDDKPAFLKTEAAGADSKKVEQKKDLPVAKDPKEKSLVNPVVKAESKKVEEAVVVVSTDDDSKLMSMIAAVLDNTEGAPDGTIALGDEGDLGDTGLEDGEALLNDTPVEGDALADAEVEDPLAEPGLPDVGEVAPEAGGEEELPPVPVEDIEKIGDAIKEDNDITDPDSKEAYTSEQAAKKDGNGEKFNKDVKFSQEDFDGTGKIKTGKDKPDAGLPSATKE